MEDQGKRLRFITTEVPLYYQLATLLREKIVSREYAPGDQIPPESRLVEDYGVSRITVREALRSLEEEALIRREPGRGTFVTERSPLSSDIELDHSIDDLISMGMSTNVRLLECVEAEATVAEAEEIGVKEGARLMRCRRLRSYRDQPYCYIINSLPVEIGRRIDGKQWESGSVLRYIEAELGIPLRIARQRIRATLADANLARWLEVRLGAPLLLVDYLIRSDHDQLVEMAHLYYRSDIYAFILHLTRDEEEVARKEGWALRDHRLEQ